MDNETLILEVSQKALGEPILQSGGVTLMITPSINEDFWLFRVKLSDKQSIVGFPKFGTIGIGFAKEEDWNTNLSYKCEAQEIFNHIADNKGDDNIPNEKCIEAIKIIQQAVKTYWLSNSQQGESL